MMKKHEIQQLTAGLSVTFMQQDDCVVAYSPALDISTYGSSEKEATKNFQDLLIAFFSQLRDTRQLESVLESMGWKRDKKTNWQPPKITQKEVAIPKEAFA